MICHQNSVFYLNYSFFRTYCHEIFRQVRDTVAWVFSEPMLNYYIQLFTKSWWPNGQLAPTTPARTDEEKLKTRGEARRQFLNNIPEVLASLVGAQSAQKGATKVFDTLQNVNLNKQLFYVSLFCKSTRLLIRRMRNKITLLVPGYF